MKERTFKVTLRSTLLATLLPLALGSTAQTAQSAGSLHGAIVRAQPAVALPAAITDSTPVASTTTATRGAPLDVPRFEAIATALVANGRIPGMAMAIIKDGKILSARGYGVTDLRDPQPIDAHTVFRLASLSKSFAATMTGILVNDGVLRWDSHLIDYVPSFQLSQPGAAQEVTVADLLSHRIGLTRNAFDRDLEGNEDYHSLTLRLANAPMTCAPGQCYAYQNVAFSLIGDIVFATTGKFYSESVASRIFKPLGMHDASYG
ncbi:MAG TPA: serine hydrolase domain-containing protein, partial [Thermomonas sp.]|nr:serine hydrolase domain-containing protein [Thermomonas sp.]